LAQLDAFELCQAVNTFGHHDIRGFAGVNDGTAADG